MCDACVLHTLCPSLSMSLITPRLPTTCRRLEFVAICRDILRAAYTYFKKVVPQCVQTSVHSHFQSWRAGLTLQLHPAPHGTSTTTYVSQDHQTSVVRRKVFPHRLFPPIPPI